jgi:hypothetical protein
MKIPNMLVAPKMPTLMNEQDGHDYAEDYDAYYEDGAYYSADVVADLEFEEGEGCTFVEPDPNLVYFNSILTRYEILRQQLQQSPPEEAVNKLDQEHPTCLGKLETKVVRWWRWKMRTTDPIPVQVACMDKGTTMKLLGLMTGGSMLKPGAEVEVGVSRWAWALLARLPERGELNSEEIGVVRDLGKKAVLVGMRLKQQQEWEAGIDQFEAEYDDMENSEGSVYVNEDEIQPNQQHGHTAHEAKLIGPQMPDELLNARKKQNAEGKEEDGMKLINDQLAAAKARVLAALQEKGGPSDSDLVITDDTEQGHENTYSDRATSRWNTKATVDMIVTVAGEMYGQRDLLEFRSVWADAD